MTTSSAKAAGGKINAKKMDEAPTRATRVQAALGSSRPGPQRKIMAPRTRISTSIGEHVAILDATGLSAGLDRIQIDPVAIDDASCVCSLHARCLAAAG